MSQKYFITLFFSLQYKNPFFGFYVNGVTLANGKAFPLRGRGTALAVDEVLTENENTSSVSFADSFSFPEKPLLQSAEMRAIIPALQDVGVGVRDDLPRQELATAAAQPRNDTVDWENVMKKVLFVCHGKI